MEHWASGKGWNRNKHTHNWVDVGLWKVFPREEATVYLGVEVEQQGFHLNKK